MKRFLPLVILMMTAVSLFAQQPKTPSVSISNVVMNTPTHVSFDIVVNADCSRYLYILSDPSLSQLAQAFGMTMEQFLSSLGGNGIDWVAAEMGQVDHYDSDDLEPATTYVIYVLAQNAQGESQVVTQEFNTSMGGGSGDADLVMTYSQYNAYQAAINTVINDQTAYYWFFTYSDDILQAYQTSVATATTDELYAITEQMVNNLGGYVVHSSNHMEVYTVGDNVEYNTPYVAVGFPFNADGVRGTFTEPIRFSLVEDGIADMERMDVQLWPNPATTVAHLRAPETIEHVCVLDGAGREVFSCNGGDNDLLLNTSALAPGLYLVRIQTQHGVVVKRMVK